MNPKLEIRDTAKYGKGVFAKESIRKESMLFVMGGYVLTIEDENTIKLRIEYWFTLSSKAKKTVGYDTAGEKISYNPDGYLGCNIVTGPSVTYAF